MFEKCPCGSGELYGKCCKPYIKGKKNAPTAEALMRSRYSAYVLHEIDYIIDTCHKKENMNRAGIEDWSEKSNWQGLKIISTSGGGIDDNSGTVIFEATYLRKDGLKHIHSEEATFTKKEERWLYEDGKITPKTIVRAGEKVGRNDPCSCRSGKKFKHCCGR